MTLHHFIYSTLRLLLKNTAAAPLISLLSLLSPWITTSCILLTLYFYLHPPPIPSLTTPAASVLGFLPSPAHLLVNVLPYLYASVLRFVSPLFTLLEGICTLLVVQVAGRVGKDWADEEEKAETGVEWRSLAGLIAAALIYAAGLAGVVKVSLHAERWSRVIDVE